MKIKRWMQKERKEGTSPTRKNTTCDKYVFIFLLETQWKHLQLAVTSLASGQFTRALLVACISLSVYNNAHNIIILSDKWSHRTIGKIFKKAFETTKLKSTAKKKEIGLTLKEQDYFELPCSKHRGSTVFQNTSPPA